jgi:hypothetical protein
MSVLSSGYLELRAGKYSMSPVAANKFMCDSLAKLLKNRARVELPRLPWYAVGFHGQLYLQLYYSSMSPGELDNLVDKTGLSGR